MDETRPTKKDSSYEWITLKPTNIDYVADVTGYSREELKKFLDDKKETGEFEVKLPLEVHIFTRKER